MTDDARIAESTDPANARYRNTTPRPVGTPCPKCQATRPKGWKGPCIHCLNTRPPHATRRAARQAQKDN